MIGSATKHNAVYMIQMLNRFIERLNTAIDPDELIRILPFQAIDAIIVQRRNIAVFLR